MKKLSIAFVETGVKVGWDGHKPVSFKFPFKIYKAKLTQFDKVNKRIKYTGTTHMGESVVVEFSVRDSGDKVTVRISTDVTTSPELANQYSVEFETK